MVTGVCCLQWTTKQTFWQTGNNFGPFCTEITHKKHSNMRKRYQGTINQLKQQQIYYLLPGMRCELFEQSNVVNNTEHTQALISSLNSFSLCCK